MKKFLWALLFMLLPVYAKAQNPIYGCQNTINVTSAAITTSGSVQLVAAPTTNPYSPTQAIHICSFDIQVIQGATAANWSLIQGTGSNCGTVPTTSAAPTVAGWLGVASTSQSIGQIYQSNNTKNLAPGQALCVNFTNAPTGAKVNVSYAIF